MMKIQEIIQEVEKYAPLALQDSYDNAGIQVGDAGQTATGILLSLDITEEVVDEASRLNCNLIIAHHPLIFKPLKSLTGKSYIERSVIKAVQKGIVIYAAHTNMDNAVKGVSYRIAQKIGLQDIRVLSPLRTVVPEMTDKVGAGVVGELPIAEDEHAFLLRLKDIFQLKVIEYSALRSRPVSKVAVCGGSGSFLIPEAITAGADAFITGEAKYNDFFDVEKNILLAVIGHYESEECTKEIFFEIITKKLPNFAVHFSNVNSNPVNYL